jgi:hypothetical protein
MPAGRAAGVRVKNAPTRLSQRTLHAGIGVGEARAPASEKVLYSAYTQYGVDPRLWERAVVDAGQRKRFPGQRCRDLRAQVHGHAAVTALVAGPLDWIPEGVEDDESRRQEG